MTTVCWCTVLGVLKIIFLSFSKAQWINKNTKMGYTNRLHWHGTSVQDMVTGNQAGIWSTWPWRVRKLPSFKTSGTNHPATHHHFPQAQNPQLHFCENLKTCKILYTSLNEYKRTLGYLKNVGERKSDVHEVQFLWQSWLQLQTLSVMSCLHESAW